MNTYKIKIRYKTGDSFHNEDAEMFLEYEWTNLDSAKKSLKHIKNHYEFYQDNSNIWEKPKGKLPDGVSWNNEYRLIMLDLVDDNGKIYNYSSFWTGYFETLYSAIIETVRDPDMKYVP